MAKSILQELEGLLDADTFAKVKAGVSSNPKLIAQDLKSAELYGFYNEGTSSEEVKVEPKVEATAVVPVTPAATGSATEDLRTLLREQFGELDKKYVAIDKLPEYRGEMTANILRMTDELATLREVYREEFGERFPRDKYEEFIETNKGKYSTLTDAFNSFVQEKRIETRVKKEVEEQVKQRASAAIVPAQSNTPAVTPHAALILEKAKGDAGKDADSHVSAAAAKLRAIRESRESREGSVQ